MVRKIRYILGKNIFSCSINNGTNVSIVFCGKITGKITCTLLFQLLIRWNKSSTASLRELVSPLFIVLLSLKQQTYIIKTLDIHQLNSLIHSKHCSLIRMVYWRIFWEKEKQACWRDLTWIWPRLSFNRSQSRTNDNDNDITLILRMLSCEHVHMRINITDIHYRLYNRNRHEQTEVDRKLTNGASSSRYVVHTP